MRPGTVKIECSHPPCDGCHARDAYANGLEAQNAKLRGEVAPTIVAFLRRDVPADEVEYLLVVRRRGKQDAIFGLASTRGPEHVAAALRALSFGAQRGVCP